MNNRDIAEMFDTVADMLAIRGDNFHRINAYRKGADAVRGASISMSDLSAAGSLTDLPGVGKTLAEKIDEMLDTGHLAFYDKIATDVPPGLVKLLKVEGMGPKRVKLAYDKLNITNLEQLKKAAEDGSLETLPKMGKKSAEKILQNLIALEKHGDTRTPIGLALPIAQQILAELNHLDGVVKSAFGGSLRRMKETIGDIDLLVGVEEGTDAAPIMQHFVSMSQVESISGQGPTKSRVTLLSGIGVDLRVLPAKNWGTLLSYFTGSKAHNVRLREIAQKQGLSLNEYSFTPEDGGDEIICADEAQVYETLGLPYIAPTLRENQGEIEVAQAGKLPSIITIDKIVADLHMHSTWSDGKHTILEMAQAAQARGLQYIVITDHSRGLGIANGLTVERLLAQQAEVRQVDEQMGSDFRVFHGTEMEIKADGSLDFEDEILQQLDFVIASLHVSTKQPRTQLMKRVMAAVDNPHVDMLAHPTNRLIGRRVGADLDIGALVMAASATGTILEINSNPRRLDLRDADARRAVQMGVKIGINTDAHHIDHLDFTHFGVATAQRGWVSADSVVNTWPVDKFWSYITRND